MNSFLAEMYGTRESIGAPQGNDDVEKLAEAQLLDEALRAENIDVDSLSPEAIVKVAQQLFGNDSALVKAASEDATHEAEGDTEHQAEGEEGVEATAEGESAEEKTAQADFLGRVMAHAFVQEQAMIEKEAGAKELAGKAWTGIKGKAEIVGKAGQHVKSHAKGLVGKYTQNLGERARGAKHRLSFATMKGTPIGGRFSDRVKLVGEAAKKMAPELAVGTAAAGGTGYAVHKAFGDHKKKAASAVDVLAEQRAMEILEQNGIGQSEDTKLASAVEQRAWEMLAEEGYVSEE